MSNPETATLARSASLGDSAGSSVTAGERLPPMDAGRDALQSSLLEAASRARMNNDLDELSTINARLRAEFPDLPDGYSGHPQRILGKFDEAEAIATAARIRFSSAPWTLIEAGETARARGDNQGALEFAEQTKAIDPSNQSAHALGITALRCQGKFAEASIAAREAATRFPDQQWPYREESLILRFLGLEDESIASAQAARRRFPDESWPWFDEAHLLMSKGLFPETERLLKEAIARFPTDQALLLTQARAAHHRRASAEADRHFEALMAAYPSNAALALEYAKRPVDYDDETAAGGGSEAIARLQQLHEKFPEFDDGYVAHVEVLMKLARFQEADDLLADQLSRIDRHQRLYQIWAEISLARRDLEEAKRRLVGFRNRFPNAPDGYLRLARVLAQEGLFEEADAICTEAERRFSKTPDVAETYALVAQLTGRSGLAVQRWREGQRLFSNEKRFPKGAHEAELAGMDEADEPSSEGGTPSAGVAEATAEISSREDAPVDLMKRFQGIGAPTSGCEFGLVQRHFGAEPLSLFRWVSVTPESFARMMADDLEGLWDETTTEIVMGEQVSNRAGDREYTLYFHRYEMHMHTFIYSSEVGEEEFIKKYRGRLRLLARKFQEDIRSAKSIFVYKDGPEPLSESAVIGLADTLRRYGDNTLLMIRQASPEHPEGSARVVSRYVMEGYVDGFMVSPEGYKREPRFDGWLTVCRQAAETLAMARKSPVA